MPCRTCDSTMANIGENERGDNFFLCPRCGTVLVDAFGQHGGKVYVPDLVKRCRDFEEKLIAMSGWPAGTDALDMLQRMRNEWHRLGLAEAIHVPSERKL